jgi:hypothetical protein
LPGERGRGDHAKVIHYVPEQTIATPEELRRFTGRPDPRDAPFRLVFTGKCPKCNHETEWPYALYGAVGVDQLEEGPCNI